jgi:hypothetical protein
LRIGTGAIGINTMNRLRSRLMHKNARYRMHSILHNREGEMEREEAGGESVY